eukprot:6673053-Prymnesium_polylepis.1
MPARALERAPARLRRDSTSGVVLAIFIHDHRLHDSCGRWAAAQGRRGGVGVGRMKGAYPSA